jgi:glycine betaine/proline transport system substrate-binding protein
MSLAERCLVLTVFSLAATFALQTASATEETDEPAPTPLKVAYVDWSSSLASANLICALMREGLGEGCDLVETTAERMWRMVAQSRADVMLSAWLPDTHAHYMRRFGRFLDDLGPNLTGTRTGLVVPAVSTGRQTGGAGMRTRPYVTVRSIADLAQHRREFSGRIIGIDPEAGIMRATREAMEVYGLGGFRLLEGSEGIMTDALATAIARQEWVVVTGWTPHWMFGRWSLRFLEDPKGVYGGTGRIHTMVRDGLADDRPQVHRVLDRFVWTVDEINQLMVWIEQDGRRDPYAQALRWLRTHQDRAQAWLN